MAVEEVVFYQLEVHLQTFLIQDLIAIGIPIEASAPKNPPSTCFLVGFKTSLPPVCVTRLI